MENYNTDLNAYNEYASDDDDSDINPPKATITIDKMGYAVGLLWQPLQNSDDPIPEIKEAMDADKNADLYCLRSTITPQYGIGKKILGHQDGQPSAGAAIASALSDKSSVVAVFPVPEGWWFIAIRNDLILSEEDKLFTTEADAMAAFNRMMRVPDWELKIVPESWKIEDSVNIALDTLIKKSGTQVRLKTIEASKKTMILLVVAIFFILAIGFLAYIASSFWDTVFKEETIEAMPIPVVIQPIEPIPEKPKPWEKIPSPTIFAYKCWNNAYQLSSIIIPGWQIGTITCTPQDIRTSWAKSWNPGGRISWVKKAIEEYKLSKLSITLDQSGTSAAGVATLTGIPSIASTPTLTASQLWSELTDIVQATNLRLSFNKDQLVEQIQTIQQGVNGEMPTTITSQIVYVFYTFSVSSELTPFEWKTFFDKFPGLELTKITFNPSVGSSDKWKYEGKIYAK